MGDSGINQLVAAIAQWLATIGIPALLVAYYRLREEISSMKIELATIKAKLAESDSLRHDVNEMKTTMTEVRIIVGELKVRLDMRNRRATDGPND